ncbi:polyketide synthetase [Hydnomerulius pinastri MD-312]|uniref:Pks3 protein n=1 Tax=Hydnomerulius pinastri MD-312 TaxID=994086 RepID=A0A0C9WEL6_9AGAM|nr:polyketide synthetase [Hydnomerulius pinastri MD-312]
MSAEIPVAVIGIGCKFPGGSDNKDLYYEFLRNKARSPPLGDGMVEPPPDRWIHEEWYGGKDEPGKYHTTKSGFISGIDQFDHLEFGISAKEAAHFDSAIRLTLEAAHAALQDSGIDYRGSNTGVFFGNLLTTADELDDDRYEINNYNGVGRCVSIRANRISFTFDLRGPSLTVDTACSASATAMHLALCSIRLGEVDQALVVGANTIINPEHTVSFSKLGVLSPTGSSKSFDASADGYARAEGIAAVLIKRLDRATQDGDSIYSVITGSAINANGKGKSLTMPEGDMQAETIKEAYRAAGRDPAEAFFVELHATGTKVGDPIETNAAGKVFSKGRDAQRTLRVGSVKANIGHTEGCSFLASLVKVSMMLHHKEIIPNIRFTKANPKIDFPALKMQVQTELESVSPEMAARDGKWVTSISSYGVGGSNAHIVMETAETVADLSKQITGFTASGQKQLYLFSIGSLTEPALGRWKDVLSKAYDGVTDDRTLRSLARDLGRQTRAYPSRSFAIASSLDASTKFSKPVLTNSNASPKLCLVFAGQGPQHVFMGRQLAESYPAFLASIRENDRILVKKYGEESMLERTGLFVPGVECKLAAGGVWPVKEVVLSLVFVQVALVDLIRSLGVQYDFVVGHSIGEIAMGYASGHYDRDMAVGIAVARAAAMTRAEGNGAMVALGVGVQKAKMMIRKVLSKEKATSGLWIAGINSPQAVTVAGSHELIDAMVELANDPKAKVFAAKLRVGCAFHTPLMGPQEELFKTRIGQTPLSQGTRPPVARVMSTTDGKWLDRDLDVNYCWDNIRRPVLFGTAINKLIADEGAECLVFLEIAPHPVLKAYIEQCGGEPVSLIRRPNPKVPAQNTGEHYQLLEGIGNLLSAGFKNVDFNKLCASPGGATDFIKAKLPEYPYNKSSCWAESASERSRRLRLKPRPIASPHFRINVDSHPDLTGHIVFDAVLFPASGYVESILENGAMVATDIVIHKPLVLNGAGALPGHAGCVIDGNKWQFRASTNNDFNNGDIILDSVYASGSFSRVNPAYNEKTPRTFDLESKLAHSRGSVTGDDFYDAIPSAYRYQDHFRNYLKVVHEIDDESSWGGKAYLTRLEVPEGTPDVFGKGYVIHPGILDSITQCGLAMFINMDSKQFDFNGVFLPVKIDALRRWDSRDSPDLDSEIKKGIWTYFTGRTWAPGGPFKSDYIIANSEGRVLFTIEGFEIARAPDAEPVPITDSSVEERLTTIWQAKSFPSSPSLASLPAQASLASVFQALACDVAAGGRKVIRAVDLADTSDIGASLDVILEQLLRESGVLVEYFCAASTPEDADAKTSLLKYGHARSLALDSWNLVDGSENAVFTSFDFALHHTDLAAVPLDIASLANFLVPNGAILLSVSDSSVKVDDGSVEPLTLSTLAEKLSAVKGSSVLVSDFVDGMALIYVRVAEPALSVSAGPFKSVIIQAFEHGREGDLVEIAKHLSAEAEFWITGNDDAAGIGALGVASCIIAESPEYKVYSVLFEDHLLDEATREKAVHDLRRNSLLLEQHMKIAKNGEVFVRRLVHGGAEVKEVATTAAGLSGASGVLAAHFPPALGPSDVEVAVEALGMEPEASLKSAVTFVGRIKSRGSSVTSVKLGALVAGIACLSPADVIVASQDAVVPLPEGITPTDAAALPIALLPSWIGLVSRGAISSSSNVLVHDGASAAGYSALQLAKRLGSKIFCTVGNPQEAEELSSALDLPLANFTTIDDFSVTVVNWIRSGAAHEFDIIFNAGGKKVYTCGMEYLSAFGSYIHNHCDETPEIPSGLPSSHVLDINRLAAISPAFLTPVISAMLEAHTSQPFMLRARAVPMSARTRSDLEQADSVVMVPNAVRSLRVDPSGQLFDPRKSYILIGGCSELGVRITEWMATHGARNIFMTSRRGPRGLTKVDNLYVRYLRCQGVQVEVIAADAIDKDHTATVVEEARKSGPVGGIFVMTVVLRDAKFTNLTQQAFDEVYQSKVAVLNTLLSCIDPSTIDFMLLFSTIGSVFGNAGQAAYCASQLYLDRIADTIPNTISMSFPPITDSGIFKRLVLATKGKANTAQLTKTGMTTAQVCNFIGDSLIRRVAHYVPMLAISDVPTTFPSSEPLLCGHLLPNQFLVADIAGGKNSDVAESPATLLATLLSMDVEQITDNALITSFGLDSLGATRYSNQLKARLNVQVSQIELLGSMTIGLLNEMHARAGSQAGGVDIGFVSDDGATKYGEPLVPVLNDRLAYDEPYTTDASPHQYRIWLAQREYDNARKRTVSKVDVNMSRYGATQWDTHEGYFVTLYSETPLDVDRMTDAFAEVVQRHGALRTSFSWNDELGRLEQTIHPSVDFRASLVDLSDEPDAAAKAYEISLALNKEPNFKLDRLPLLIATMFDLGGGDWAFNIVIHHIIIDEASLGVFFYELFNIYLNGPGSLPDVPIHYSDFSDWLQKTSERRGELREEHLRFWAKNLEETQPLHLTLATPSDRELAPVTQIEAKIGVGALEQYTKVINVATATSFAGFFAAYNVLLHKYSDQASFVVGTAVTQRNLPMLTNVIGFFANMLPIKTIIDETATFSEYLGEFKESLIACLSNDEVTYEDIVAQGKSSSSGRGYFKHLFAPGGMNMETISQLESNHLQPKSTISLPNGEEQYEFLLTVHPKSGHVILRFDNHLYTEDAARQFLDAYISLVETLGRDAHVKIKDISVVSDSEHDRLIKELSSTTEVAVDESCLHKLVEAQAQRTPRFTAVEFEDQSLTYSELNGTANRIAKSLIQQGVRQGDIVALCFDRGISQILGILSVLKAGATFVPLDPDDPTLRKELMIEECGAKVLLTTSSHSRVFQKSLATKVLIAYIDDPSYQKRLSRFGAEDFDVEGLSPSSLAYIMFTSGSTGKPKGVMIEHRSISNLVQSSGVYGFKQGVRVMSSLAYTFDPFVVDVFGTLSHGATLVTGRKELVLGDISKAIRTLRISVLHVTPSILAVVPVDDYPTLETVVVAGEALGKKLIEDWSGCVTLRNMYGPTEASVDCTSCHVISPSLTGVIGRPLPNCRIYILDKQLRPTPIGVEGELYIGGIQLARGYLNQPELTAAAFIANPFVAGERVYKTGDIALYRSDGNIEYCGRADRQIKLRGQRIELCEIEDTIAKYPSVQRTAVIIRTVQDAPAIVAFVEFKSGLQAQLEEQKEALKVFVAERLPRFMYPSLVAILPSLPASRSGKIDRNALKQMDLATFSPDLDADMGSPSSDVEVELMAIFSKILKVLNGSFGVAHDLFAVGLNSLMAVQAAGIISKTFNVHIGLNNIYLRPTIRELGNLIVDAMGQDSRAIMEAEDADSDFLIEFLPIKKKGVHPRLFIVHDITGMATPFMRLGAFMPNEMYAIGDKHFGSPTGFGTIESMADHYISLIKTVQPEGPYIICGYSYGGSVALCIATKLTKAGETVQHLVLFDPIYIPASERQSLKSTDWTQRSIDRISSNFPDIGEKWKTKLRTEIRKNLDSMFDFEPEHYDGPTTLVVPKDRSWYRSGHASDFDTGADDHNGWDYRIKNLDIKVASGRHDTMFAPAHVKVLAEVMKEILPAAVGAPEPAPKKSLKVKVKPVAA